MKANQPTLLDDCKQTAKEEKVWQEYTNEIEKNRNRIEVRSIRLFNNFEATNEGWDNIITLAEISRDIERYNTKEKKWAKSHETSYFVSTITLIPQEFLACVRNHWSIENSNHYVRDVAFEEDKSRIRSKAFNVARIRSFALNIMRFNKVTNIKNERYKCSLDPGSLELYEAIW